MSTSENPDFPLNYYLPSFYFDRNVSITVKHSLMNIVERISTAAQGDLVTPSANTAHAKCRERTK